MCILGFDSNNAGLKRTTACNAQHKFANIKIENNLAKQKVEIIMFVYECGRKVQSSILLPHHTALGQPPRPT